MKNKVGSESTKKGNKEKGCGDEQRGEKREELEEVRGEEEEVGKVERVRKNGETKIEEVREEMSRELILLVGSV